MIRHHSVIKSFLATVLAISLTACDDVLENILNHSPSANAGTDQSVNEAETVSLDGNASADPDGTITNYSWTQISGAAVVLTEADTATASFVAPPVVVDTIFIFQLTVTDDHGATADDSVSITILNIATNQPPLANAGSDQNVNEGMLVSLSGVASTDPDGSLDSYLWTQTSGPVVTLTGGNTATSNFTAPAVASDTVFAFTLTVTDNNGVTADDSVSITINNSTSPPVNAQDYIPPIGIPAPEFGINESHMMYVDSQYDFGNGPEPYKDAGYGPYTHYLDNSVSCTDSDNTFGTVDNPRCNLPNLHELASGSVVEIHGGIYTSSQNWMTSTGTVDKPIFIRGYANPNWVIQDDAEGKPVFVQTSSTPMPVIERTLRIRGAYIIVENIDFNKNNRRESAVDIRPANLNESVHHIVVRNSEVQNYQHRHAGAGSLLAASGFEENFVHNIVYYKNNVHADNSFYDFNTDGDAIDQYQDDTMGIGVAPGSDRIWIVDNHIHHNAGDAVGTGHAAKHTATNYYIGRNIMNDCDENAVDLKEVENVVVSQNIMYDFYGAGQGSDGTITVVHDGPNLSPRNTWFIYNEMYNASDNAVQVGGSVDDDVYYVGNVIYDISNDSQTGAAFRSWASESFHMVGNTVYDTDIGLVVWSATTGAMVTVENNIFSNLKTAGYIELSNAGGYRERAVISNNLFHSSEFTPIIEGNSMNEVILDPLFVNPDNTNFSLQNIPVQSPAIDSGMESDVYQIFQDRFDIDIRVDFNGLPRPSSSDWDIGAYEFSEG
ncbi:MAG: PKD domain-containing protein [Gammaproteobacteria bacterium]|nr:PKD domain-containing protein [Gammaproteobacteria bacterium]